MKIGLIARGEDRGLGNLLWEFSRHVRPHRTLLVVPDGVQKAGLVTHIERFPDATPVRFGQSRPGSLGEGMLDEKTCRTFLDGLDVVYTAETFYDWRFVRWAMEAGVATVCHVMPEFARPEWFDQPTMWWAPTRYRLSLLPESARVVPVPIARDRYTDPEYKRLQRLHGVASEVPIDRRPLRWLHVAGAQTIQDRNGTAAVLRALRFLDRPTKLTIMAQTPFPGAIASLPSHVDVRVIQRSIDNYWHLYLYGTALVLPRRYAGLCLPALEAMGAGLAVLMSDMPPQNEEWPVATVPIRPGSPIRLSGGTIETGDVDALQLAQRMDQWATFHERFEDAIIRSERFGDENSWGELLPMVLDELALAVERQHRAPAALLDRAGATVPRRGRDG